MAVTIRFLLIFNFILFMNAANAESIIIPTPKSKSIYQFDYLTDGILIGVGAVGSYFSLTDNGSSIRQRCPCDSNEVNSIDRYAVGNKNDFHEQLSDITVALAIGFPVVLDLNEVGLSEPFVEDMLVYLEVLSLNGAMTTLAKYSVQRPLPRSYGGDQDMMTDPKGYRSFYSGHTSSAFAALTAGAMTHVARHPEDKWPWYVAGIVGTSVAFERVAAGRHFPTDVTMGAIAGSIIGISVPYFHQRPEFKNQTFAMVPTPEGAAAMWKMRY
ncbi:MAG: phosphatase PAP2 family protein [Bdellovibrionota bacterium]